MKQDTQPTKKILTVLLRENSLESEKRIKEAIADAEKRIKGSLMVEIKELSESIFKLEMKEDKHYNFLVDKLDWLVGAYTKFNLAIKYTNPRSC